MASTPSAPAMSPKSQQDQSIPAGCGAESQVSACTPKHTAVLQGGTAEMAEPTGSNGPRTPKTGCKKGRQVRLCSLCRTVHVMCPIGRCQPCNALYNRVRNNIRRVDQWIVNAWNNTDKDNKADFIRSCRGLAGPTIIKRSVEAIYIQRNPIQASF